MRAWCCVGVACVEQFFALCGRFCARGGMCGKKRVKTRKKNGVKKGLCV